MVFYVIVVPFPMTLLMDKFTSNVELIEIWIKHMPIIRTKSGILCNMTSM